MCVHVCVCVILWCFYVCVLCVCVWRISRGVSYVWCCFCCGVSCCCALRWPRSVGDDGISIKSGFHDFVNGKAVNPVPTANVLVVNTLITSRNFAVGSAVFGGVYNVTVRNCTIGDLRGSSPWAVKVKMADGGGGGVFNFTVQDTSFGVIAPNDYQQPKGGTALVVVGSYSVSDGCRAAAAVAAGGGGLGSGSAGVGEDVGGVRPLVGLPGCQGDDWESPSHRGPPEDAAGVAAPPYPTAVGLQFVNVSVAGCVVAGSLTGMPGTNLSAVVLDNFVVSQWDKMQQPWRCADISGTVVRGEVVPGLPAECGVTP